MIKTDEQFDVRFVAPHRLAKIGRCEALFMFECLMGLKPPDASDIKLDYGTVMHLVLPHMYAGDSEKAIEVFREEWGKYDYGEEDEIRNTERSIVRIENFVKYHTPDACPYEILHFDFSPADGLVSENEIPFLIDIGAEYPLCGRIDASVLWKASDEEWAYDFKTSRELSGRYFEGFWLSPQSLGYTLALSQIRGMQIRGLIYEGMRMSKTNVETQIGHSWVSEANLKLFIEETKITCARIAAANERGEWRQNHTLCSAYAGFGFPCSPCKFKTICDSPNWQDGARFFERRKKPFDPLDQETW